MLPEEVIDCCGSESRTATPHGPLIGCESGIEGFSKSVRV